MISLMTEQFFSRVHALRFTTKTLAVQSNFNPRNVQDGQYLLDAKATYGVVVGVGLWLWRAKKRCKSLICSGSAKSMVQPGRLTSGIHRHPPAVSPQVFVSYTGVGPN